MPAHYYRAGEKTGKKLLFCLPRPTPDIQLISKQSLISLEG